MADPTIDPSSRQNEETLLKERKRRQSLSRSVDEKRAVLFKIYFLSLIGLSCILLVYYWPQLTLEERNTAFNLTIANDTKKLHEVEKNINMTSVSSAEHQVLLDKKDQLANELKSYNNASDTLRMKLDGKIPLDSNDWLSVGVVKNFVIVILAGTLGGSVAAFRSFNKFLGLKKLMMSWNSWYLFRPIQGSVMGLITYILVRSGIYAGIPGASLDSANLFVVAAGAIVAGLYSDELYSKFHEVFDTLFKTKTQGGDGIEAQPKYPPMVMAIIENSMVPDNEIVVVRTNNTTSADQKCAGAFEQSKFYWMVELRKGKEGVYWISDDNKTIVCHYYT